MVIEAVDLTTAPFLLRPEQAFKVAGIVNDREPERPVGIEVYPTLPRLVTQVLKPSAVVTADKIQTWYERYNSKAVRVHLPWTYNLREALNQALLGGHYISLSQQLIDWALMYTIGTATNNYGVNIAKQLGIGVNVHPNVIAGYVKEGKLEDLKSNVAFVYGENSVEHNALYQKDKKVLGDPRQTVRNDTVGHNLDGFLLAIDHIFGLNKNSDPQFIQERLSNVIKILDDEQIQQHTKAMHLALPGHEFIEVGDANMETLLKEMAPAPFKHPVRVALDIHPHKVMVMTSQQRINYIRSFRDWVFNTVERYN